MMSVPFEILTRKLNSNALFLRFRPLFSLHKFITLLTLLSLLTFAFLVRNNFSVPVKAINNQLAIEITTLNKTVLDKHGLRFSLASAVFTPLSDHYLNLGTRNLLWLKVTLLNNENDDRNISRARKLLVIKKNRINTPAELHYLTLDNTWAKEIVQGSAQFHQNIVTRLPTDLMGSSFYIKLHGRYLRASFFLFDDAEFFDELQLSALYSGLFFGMLLLFSLYHIMLYLRLKTPAYLAYSVMLLLLGLWFLSGQGWLEYLFPQVSFVKSTTVLLGGLLVIAIGEFAKYYLVIKTLARPVYRVLVSAQLILMILLIARLSVQHLLPSSVNQLSYGVGLLTSLVIFIACLSAAIIGVKNKKTAAGYYLTATILFFVIATLMGLAAGNIINFHFSWPLLQLASVIEVIIFSAGLVSLYYHQQQNEQKVELQLQQAQQKLVKQLEISNQLKDKVLNNVVDHKLFPALAKVAPFLTDIIYVQALGNESLIVYQKNQRKVSIEVDCNLQNLLDSFGETYLIRVHKSYLVNPEQAMSLQRRTSADYDLQLVKATVPVGRKYLSAAKKLL